MRYGVLSDIHANLAALRAVLSALRSEGVDGYLCCGDLVGYGPQPNETVETLAGARVLCVAGNHDLIATGRLADDRCVPLARTSLRWTQDVLAPDVRAFLEGLPQVREVAGLVLAHGSLDDPQEYVERAEQADRQIGLLAAGYPSASLLLLGHTHRPWLWSRGEELEPAGPVTAPLPDEASLINPGSVGQSVSRVPLARFVVLDLDRREASFHAVPYDHTACRRALREQGLDPRSCHPYRSVFRSWASRVKHLALRAAGAVPVER